MAPLGGQNICMMYHISMMDCPNWYLLPKLRYFTDQNELNRGQQKMNFGNFQIQK